MIDALIKHVSVTYKCYEMYAHRGEKVQLLIKLNVHSTNYQLTHTLIQNILHIKCHKLYANLPKRMTYF
jgi:hypothetical protein